MILPHMYRVRQSFDSTHIGDVEGAVRSRLLSAGIRERIKPGTRIAITASSRGANRSVEILRTIVNEVRACGAEPILLPAMGSHGGSTESGQIDVLRAEGITEETVGAPIRATMETQFLG